MSGDGKNLNIRKWKETVSATSTGINQRNQKPDPFSFEYALLQQRPEIEDDMERLARTLARVHGLEEEMANLLDDISFVCLVYNRVICNRRKCIF
jgi:hypothetical protein